jgi:hypothetical protein
MVDAERIAGGVLTRIPAPYRQIQTTSERNEIVYDDDLLMLRRSKR